MPANPLLLNYELQILRKQFQDKFVWVLGWLVCLTVPFHHGKQVNVSEIVPQTCFQTSSLKTEGTHAGDHFGEQDWKRIIIHMYVSVCTDNFFLVESVP